MEALWLSLEVALLATLAVAALGTPAALLILRAPPTLGRALEALLLIPLVAPPSVTGLGLLWVLGRHGPLGSLGASLGLGTLLFTPGAAVLAAAIVSFPLFLRSARVALAEVSPAYLQLAQSLGDAPLRAVWRVQLPLARRGLLAGAALAFGRAMGEFGATLMVAGNIPGRTETLAVSVYDHAMAGETTEAWSAATVLVAAGAVVLVAMMVAEPRR